MPAIWGTVLPSGSGAAWPGWEFGFGLEADDIDLTFSLSGLAARGHAIQLAA